MKLIWHDRFTKAFDKLSPVLRKKVLTTIELFKQQPFHPKLRNHSLKVDMFGKRAISVTIDLRILFEEVDGYSIILLLKLGTHNQVYH